MLKAAAERATVEEAKVPLTEMTEGPLRKTDLPDTRETAGHRAVSKDKFIYCLIAIQLRFHYLTTALRLSSEITMVTIRGKIIGTVLCCAVYDIVHIDTYTLMGSSQRCVLV